MKEKMYKLLLFILFFQLSSCNDTSITVQMRTDVGIIKGTLINPEVGTPITNLEIYLAEQPENKTTTDNDGKFEFEANEIGDYTIVTDDEEYAEMSIVVSNNKTYSDTDTHFLPKKTFASGM